MDGNGIAFRVGRPELVSVGDAALALNCATPPKAVICGEADEGQSPRSFARLSVICRLRNRGFLTYFSSPQEAADLGVCELS